MAETESLRFRSARQPNERQDATPIDLIREIRKDERFKAVLDSEKPAPESERKPERIGNLSDYMRTERARQRASANAALTINERQEAEKKNPFRRGPSFNLTEQMRLMKRDPAVASHLRTLADMESA